MPFVVLIVALATMFVPVAWLVGVTSSYVARAAYLGAARAPLSPVEGLSIVLREAVAQSRIVWWNVTRRGSGDVVGAIPGDTSDDAVVPVVLAHGLAGDGTSMWKLRQSLADRGRPTYAPHLGRMFRPVERYAEALENTIDRALREHPNAPGFDVVAHSMGGIVLRQCLRMRPDLAARVRRVVTIASPHAGTRAATHLPTVEARALFPGSPWLVALPPLRGLLPQAQITTIASPHDAIVYPHDTARVDGASHHELGHFGHAELLTHPRVVELVQSALL